MSVISMFKRVQKCPHRTSNTKRGGIRSILDLRLDLMIQGFDAAHENLDVSAIAPPTSSPDSILVHVRTFGDLVQARLRNTTFLFFSFAPLLPRGPPEDEAGERRVFHRDAQ